MTSLIHQSLHIFRKDARHLRLEISGALIILLLFVVTGVETWDDVLQRGRPDQFEEPFILLLPLVWCLLIARAVHDEALPGDRHFWLTRPYHRVALVAAKALFIAAFVNLPLMLAQAASLLLSGLPVSISGLLWTQWLVAVLIVAPAAAVAALTRNLAQFLPVAVVVVALVSLPIAAVRFEGDLAWVRSSIGAVCVMLIAALVIWRQYRLRRSFDTMRWAVGGSVAAAILFVAFPQRAAIAIQSIVIGSRDDAFQMRLAAPPGRTEAERVSAIRNGALAFPVAITGASTEELRINFARMTFRTLAGDTRESLGVFAEQANGMELRTFVDAEYLERAQNAPVQITVEAMVTRLGNARTAPVPLDGTPVYFDGLGQCGAVVSWDRRWFVCRGVMQRPGNISSDRVGPTELDDMRWETFSPFPAGLRLRPIVSRRYELRGELATDLAPMAPEAPATITIREPVAYFRYEMQADGVRIGDYAVLPPEYAESEEPD